MKFQQVYTVVDSEYRVLWVGGEWDEVALNAGSDALPRPHGAVVWHGQSRRIGASALQLIAGGGLCLTVDPKGLSLGA